MIGESPMQPIVLTGSQFEIVFQVTYQVTNFQEHRLRELGVSLEDLDSLIAALRVFRDAAERATFVRITFLHAAADADRYLSGETASRDGDKTNREFRVDLSVFWASRWRRLLELVTSGLSHRELFLRTGFEWNEIADAVAHFEN